MRVCQFRHFGAGNERVSDRTRQLGKNILYKRYGQFAKRGDVLSWLLNLFRRD